MAEYPADITATDEWSALAEHYGAIADLHLRTLFADDPGRADALTASGADLVLDYSKHRITRDTLPLLTALARRAGLPERTEAMFAGAHINTSEDRAVLHTALRAPRELALAVDGQDVPTDVHRVLGRMGEFTDAVRSGEWTGHTGERITAVVNIGIGGSDLGPVMAYEALRDYADRDADDALRLQHRPHRHLRGAARPRPGHHPVHHLVQDLHHPGDADQRPRRPRVAARRARRR